MCSLQEPQLHISPTPTSYKKYHAYLNQICGDIKKENYFLSSSVTTSFASSPTLSAAFSTALPASFTPSLVDSHAFSMARPDLSKKFPVRVTTSPSSSSISLSSFFTRPVL